MAYNQDKNPLSGVSMFGPSANIFKKKANNNMKVRIKPGKEGKLSNYAMDHITKANKRGKVTIEVPKSDKWNEKSKLFNNDFKSVTDEKGRSYINTYDPAGQSSAGGFKKARRRDRLKTIGSGVLGGLIISPMFGGSMSVDDPPEEELSKREERKAKKYTEEVTGVLKGKVNTERLTEREKNKKYKALRKNTKPQSKHSKKKAIRKAKNNAQYKSDVKGDGICTKSTCLADPVTGVKKNPTKKR